MKLIDIFEMVKNNTMDLDMAGHVNKHCRHTFLFMYEHLLKNFKHCKWTKQKLNTNIEQNETITDLSLESIQCKVCGKRLRWVLTGDKLQLRSYFDMNKSEFEVLPSNYVCEKPKPTTGKIIVNSDLYITSIFPGSQDSPDALRYKDEYDLETLNGRIGITKHKEKSNYAWGQMQDGSFGVYVNPQKTSIIIGPSYSEKKKLFKNHKMIGIVNLDVWRWEATDESTLGIKLNSNYVKIKAKHGIWKFKHFRDIQRINENESSNVYARLDLMRS